MIDNIHHFLGTISPARVALGKTLRTFIPWIILTLICLQPFEAAAEDSMTFSFELKDFRKYGLGLYQVIHANGAITGGTAGSLRIFAQEHHIMRGGAIYFQSDGGLLSEGVKVGRLIRELGLDTYIGGIDPKEPGYCLSACSLAYLGGVSRFMNDAATYSVQRFYRRAGDNQEFDLAASQVFAGEITNFIKDMGVNPSLFKFMLLPGNESLVGIDKNTLVGFKAVNDGIFDEKWEIALNDKVPYLLGTVRNNHGTHKLTFMCNSQNNTLAGAGFLENSDPQWILENSAYTKGLFIGKDAVEMHTANKAEQNYVELLFPVSPDLSERLSAAPSLGIYFQPYNIPFPVGFKIRQTDESMLLMKHYFNSCFTGKRE